MLLLAALLAAPTPHHADAATLISAAAPLRLPGDPTTLRDAAAAWEHLVRARGVPATSIRRVDSPRAAEAALALRASAAAVQPGGVWWVFWSGWGARSPWDHRRLLLTAETPRFVDALGRTGIGLDDLGTWAAGSQADLAVWVLDLSFDGVDHDGAAILDEVTPRGDAEEPAPSGVFEITLAPGQAPETHPASRQGLLTWVVLGGLRGWADRDADATITAGELAAWLPEAWAALGRPADGLSVQLPAEATGVVLAAGATEPPPDLSRQGLPEPPSSEAAGHTGEDEEVARIRADQARTLRDQVQAEADRAWSDAMRRMGQDPADGRAAVARFIERFSAITFPLPDGDVVISAEQIPRARALLTGERPDQVRVDAAWLPAGDWPIATPDGPRTAPIARPLWIGRDEVSQRLFTELMGYNPSAHRGDALPVELVTFSEALAFCNALSRRDGLRPAYHLDGRRVVFDPTADGWRLPTELEWRVAAGDAPWSGFDDDALACTAANLLDEGSSTAQGAAACDDGDERTAPVGRRPGNALGLRDLTGNVAEWVWDAWTPYPSSGAPPDHPTGPRVVKGGSFRTAPADAESWDREAAERQARAADLGFRVVRTATPAPPPPEPEPEPEEAP